MLPRLPANAALVEIDNIETRIDKLHERILDLIYLLD
jgi:hypothetical protein